MSEQFWTMIAVGLFGILTTYLTLSAPRRMAKITNEAAAAALKLSNERADGIAADAKRDTEAVRVQAEKAAALLVESNAAVVQFAAERIEI